MSFKKDAEGMPFSELLTLVQEMDAELAKAEVAINAVRMARVPYATELDRRLRDIGKRAGK